MRVFTVDSQDGSLTACVFFKKTSWNQTSIICDDRLDVCSRSPGPFIWHLLKTLLHLSSVFHPPYLPPSQSDTILSYHQTPATAAPPLLRNINTATAGASDLDGPFFQKIPPPCRRCRGARESHMFFWSTAGEAPNGSFVHAMRDRPQRSRRDDVVGGRLLWSQRRDASRPTEKLQRWSSPSSLSQSVSSNEHSSVFINSRENPTHSSSFSGQRMFGWLAG